MRNKGALWTLTIALTVVCIYQLSFSLVGLNIRKAAKEYAAGNPVKQDYYLDSIAGEEVYNILLKKFTYREVQEREVNFGLDLKGGMNVILEISTVDVLKTLAGNSKDTTFIKAIALAKEMQKSSKDNFVTLFGKAFEQIDPNAQLSSIFVSPDLRSKIRYDSKNSEVLEVIRAEANGAIDNAFIIIASRIDQFGVTSPNIQRLEGGDRILVDLPGVKNKERVRKLLQGTANLEFWETYDMKELQQGIVNSNKIISEYLKTQADINGSSLKTTPVITADTTNVKTNQNTTENSLLSKIQNDTTTKSADSLTAKTSEDSYPLFKVFQPSINFQTGEVYPGAILGRAHFKDTTKINLYLRIAKAKNIFPRDAKFLWSAIAINDPTTKRSTDVFELYAIKASSRDGKAPLDGDAIVSASQEFDQARGFAYVLMDMNPVGSKTWARITRENKGKVISVVMDNRVYSAPTVQDEITGGSSQITGNFSVAEAQDLSNLLRSGKLPAPAHIVEETIVGPSLGKKAVDSGLNSFIIAFIFILVYMVFYYSRSSGLVANIALLANMFFIFGVMASLNAVLTLPGIAGIILTLGMAVDANVLIYERIREEIHSGKGLRLAISDGFKHALSAIIDGNVTTLITGIVLYYFGSGPIKGFATTLVIGLLTSLFSAIFISRLIFEIMLKKNMNITFSTKLSENVFKNANFDFIGKRWPFYIISSIIMVVGIGSIFIRGFDKGVDFTGGRNYIVKFEKSVQPGEIKDLLSSEFGKAPNVIIYGSDNQVRITTRYRIDEEGAQVDEEILQSLYKGLKPALGSGVDYATFMEKNWMASQKVGPSIADDIKRGAVIAILLSLVAIFLYIVLRFRNWQFGLGATVALMHDAFFVIGVFSLMWGFLPFSLEIDQSFIAAILTVIGYSINDTVVIFDRIREYNTLYPKRDRKDNMNHALNSTLGRTFSTSFTVFIVLLAMFVFGGEVIRGFVFAMLIGVISGIYSTLFIATPIVFDTVKIKKDKKS